MEKLSSVVGMPLFWVQPAAGVRDYELRADDCLVGELRFASSWGSLALATADEDRWTLKRVGFLNPRVTVRAVGHREDVAVYYPRWSGDTGTLEFADGRRFQWQTANFWRTKYQLTAQDGRVLVTFTEGSHKQGLSEFFKTQAFLEIEPEAMDLADLPLLLLVAWYLLILGKEDAAAVAAATAAI